MSRALVVGAVAVVLAACGHGGGKPEAKRAPRTPRVGVLAAPTRALDYAVEALGTLEAYQVVPVPARVDGVVEAVGFDEGRSVSTTTVLAVVDGARRDLLVTQAERAVATATAAQARAAAAVPRAAAQEAAARAGLAEAEGNLARRESARAKAPGLVTDEEIEAARAQVARWKAQVDEAVAAAGEAEAARKQAEAVVEESRSREVVARRDAADARVVPPLAGVVQAKHVVVGQWVRAGQPVATLVDASRLRVRFRVPEAESVALVPGRVEVVFRAAALPDRETRADLLLVQGSADPVTRMVECLAQAVDPDPALKPGFFANVVVRVGRSAASVVVPDEAVLATERGLLCFVVRDGKAQARKVRLGLRTRDGWVEVLDGVAAGEALVLENASVLTDGATVETFPSARAPGAPPAPPAPAGGPSAPDPSAPPTPGARSGG